MSAGCHVYTRPRQPLTGYRDPYLRRRVTNPGNRLFRTWCCGKRRPARNLEIQMFYDEAPVWCRPETGCRRPRRRLAAVRIIARDFQRGLSMVGLGRKYGRTRMEIETLLRRFTRRTR